jgi:hypothetical protein
MCNAVLPSSSFILTSIPLSIINNSTILSFPIIDAKIDYFYLILIFLFYFIQTVV